MFTIPPRHRRQGTTRQGPERLSVRWVLIAVLAVSAGFAGLISGGPAAAIVTGCAVVTAAHHIIA